MSEDKLVEVSDKTDINHLLKTNKQYTYHMVRLIQPEIYNTFQTIYSNIKKSSKTQTGILIPFQNSVAEIPKWSQETLNEKVKLIRKSSDCEWFDNLVEAVLRQISKYQMKLKKYSR